MYEQRVFGGGLGHCQGGIVAGTQKLWGGVEWTGNWSGKVKRLRKQPFSRKKNPVVQSLKGSLGLC